MPMELYFCWTEDQYIQWRIRENVVVKEEWKRERELEIIFLCFILLTVVVKLIKTPKLNSVERGVR